MIVWFWIDDHLPFAAHLIERQAHGRFFYFREKRCYDILAQFISKKAFQKYLLVTQRNKIYYKQEVRYGSKQSYTARLYDCWRSCKEDGYNGADIAALRSSGNKLNSVSESRKTLILQGFPGFLFFTGYKLATSGRFFVAIVFCGYHVKLIGYFGLLIRVQMAVGFHGSLYPFMS